MLSSFKLSVTDVDVLLLTNLLTSVSIERTT